MKLQKNKVVFVLVLACVVLFITVYAILTFGKDKKEALEPDRIPMPDLEENPVEYESKLEALEAIKQERETTAPAIYPEHMVDDKGYFNPDYMAYEKQRIIDSIHMEGRQKYGKPKAFGFNDDGGPKQQGQAEETQVNAPKEGLTDALGLEHQLFFASNPDRREVSINEGLLVRVDGKQTVREGHRIELRLETDYMLNGIRFPINTRVYGFVKIRPNRVLVEVTQIGATSVELKGHDHQDGREGIYVENHLRGAIISQGLDETIREVNIPGVPQLGGIKGLFRKDNRSIKVEIPNHYQLRLKP
ncbi:conjugative transposon protein TraM [Muricauda sp. NFXS6]|uniref:conjugative transposon protein TraM n=1 Tax=Allomuricauda sp. NFXS6 TaxID=2819094 RepID=UPI0032DF9CE6